MAHWVSSRPRDDIGSSRRTKQDDWRTREVQRIWKKRIWLVCAGAALSLTAMAALVAVRSQDVNALSAAGNKKIQALQAERDDLTKKLNNALEENRRLKVQLERAKNSDSRDQDRGYQQENTPRSSPATSPR